MRPYEIKEAEKKKSQEAARYQHIVERVGGIDVHDYKQSEFAKYFNEHSKKYGEKLHIRKGNNYLKKVMSMLEQEK